MSADAPRLLLVEPIPEAVAAAVRSWAPDAETVGGPGRLRTEPGPVVLLAAGSAGELEPVLRAGREVDDVTAIAVVPGPEEGARALSAGAVDYVLISDLPRLVPALRRALADAEEGVRRERAEHELRASEARYREVFESVPAGIYRSTPEGKIVEANRGLAEMLGYQDVDSLMAADAAELYVDPGERERWKAGLASRGSIIHDMQQRRRDGRVIWVRDHARAVLDERGEVRFYDGIQEDITEWKGVVHKVQFQASLLKQVRNAVVATDAEDRLTYWNPYAERLYGWSAEETLGRPYPEVLRSPDGDEVEAAFWEGIRGAGYWEGEIEVVGRHGTTIPTFVFAQQMIGEDGLPAGIVNVAIDLTERKGAEREIAANLETLRKTDEERRALLARLVRAQEEERERLSDDIHDGLVHVMTAAALRLATVRRSPDGDPEALAKVEESIQRATSRLRHFVSELHPRELDRDGLGAALNSHLASIAADGGPRVTLDDHLSTEPPPGTRLTMYRAIQGTISEARRGRADSVAIGLNEDGGSYRARLEIRGRYIRDASDTTAAGLRALGERVELTGGMFLVTEEAEGTVVDVSVRQ
ncbi:MAG: PAS domain-containing sensor histidine kinase [Actinomycetota bacterium]